MDATIKAHVEFKKAEKAYVAFERKCEEHTEAGIAAYERMQAAKKAWMNALISNFA